MKSGVLYTVSVITVRLRCVGREGLLSNVGFVVLTVGLGERKKRFAVKRKCGQEVMRCQFNQDGSLLAVGLTDGAIKVYSPDSGDHILTLRDLSSAKMPVTGLQFISSSSHCLLLAAYAMGSVRCWYPWGRDFLWTLTETNSPGDIPDGGRGSQREALCLAVSPSGERAATGCSNSTVCLYDLHTHQSILTCQASSCKNVMDGHRSRVFAVTFHPERETEFISGGWDNTIQEYLGSSCLWRGTSNRCHKEPDHIRLLEDP